MATVYEIVTSRIIEKLEQGVIPWRRPWKGGAVNWESQRPYRGVNTLLLDAGEYATFNQIRKAGGKVKKGEKSHIVVFWKMLDKETEKDGEVIKETIPLLRYYRVFEINTQVEGLESKRKDELKDHDPILEAEKIIEGYKDCPPITFKENRAWYSPSRDIINIPELKHFDKVEEYYSTLFHEMAHSTGHKSRLNRKGITDIASFGSETYSMEELVAETCAAMLCGVAGIENVTLDNSASYINSWLRVLKEDSKIIVYAAARGQRAADYIRGISYEN